MIDLIPFGEGSREPAPARGGCTHLDAAPILADPLVVEHHYRPGGYMEGFPHCRRNVPDEHRRIVESTLQQGGGRWFDGTGSP